MPLQSVLVAPFATTLPSPTFELEYFGVLNRPTNSILVSKESLPLFVIAELTCDLYNLRYY
jgi:hypothetical protein